MTLNPLFTDWIMGQSETRFRYVFGSKLDANREITMTLTTFDVPTDPT